MNVNKLPKKLKNANLINQLTIFQTLKIYNDT
jgi:hypothetical protein